MSYTIKYITVDINDHIIHRQISTCLLTGIVAVLAAGQAFPDVITKACSCPSTSSLVISLYFVVKFGIISQRWSICVRAIVFCVTTYLTVDEAVQKMV